MTDQQKDTEQLIFEAASRVFQRKGYGGARMQEIADEADINKSMLHYYYRSKDKLFQKVYQAQMGRFFPVLFDLWNADLPLNEKVEQIVNTFYSFLNDNPRMAQFVIHEMNQNPDRFRKFMEELNINRPKRFYRQIEEEAEKGNVLAIDPRQLTVSIVALTLFPFIAGTMVQGVLELDEHQFQKFLQERKEFLVNFILNGINYNLE